MHETDSNNLIAIYFLLFPLWFGLIVRSKRMLVHISKELSLVLLAQTHFQLVRNDEVDDNDDDGDYLCC